MTKQVPPELARVFANELRERLHWFVRLRWFAVGGVIVMAAAAQALGALGGWQQTWTIAVPVAGYNAAFQAIMRTREQESNVYWLTRCTLAQITLDLAALLGMVALTGGGDSPFVAFFVLHMVIGTIMLSGRTMTAVATALWLVCVALVAVRAGTWAAVAGEPAVRLGLLGALLGLSVYLTETVAVRLKERGVALFQLAEELGARKAQVESALAEMGRIEERKSKFMLLSAHQLRSPLGTVKASLDVLRQGYVEPSSERGARLLDGASARVDDLLRIVGDLMELAKVREGSKRAPWTPNVLIKQILLDILDALQTVAEERGITLQADMPGNGAIAMGVPPDLVYAFENVIHNAIKYSNRGGLVAVELREDERAVVVTVRDEGIGIPAAFLANLFGEFSRAPNAKRHAAEGTGLGLAIVKEVVEAHGGTVTAESAEGRGTVMTLTLPRRAAAVRPGRAGAAAVAAAPAHEPDKFGPSNGLGERRAVT